MAKEYTFIPWLRRGLASNIQQIDEVGAPARAELDIQIRLNEAAPAQPPELGDAGVKLRLFGPGDVVSFNRKQITRIEPRPGSAKVIPNNFPLVEFARADLPWLFTPARANSKQQLRPWLVLIAVKKAEGVKIQRVQGKLDVISGFSSDDLPPLEESWGWVHAHASEEVTGPALRQLVAEHPERVGSRLMCPRKLDANTNYIACLVPAFESGVQAGFGKEPSSSLKSAWTRGGMPAGGSLPMYFHWEFSTGDSEDFESLARKLQPRQSSGLGSRLLDVSAPGFGMPTSTPTGAGATLAMEGALTPPRFQSTVWDSAVRTRFEDALVLKLNAPAVYLEQGLATGDPIVAPPIYGRWHAAQTKVARTGGKTWLRELNLDPRNRVAAAYGTRVVQDNQERLMDEAWEQVGELREAGRLFRRAQLARAMLGSAFTRHVSTLSPGALLQISRPTLSRVKVGALTARAEIAKTALPIGLLSPAVLRVLRPRGPLTRHVFDPAVTLPVGRGGPGLIDRVVVGTASGTMEAAPLAPPVPGGAATPKSGATAIWPAWLPREILDFLELTLEELVKRYPILRASLEFVRALQRLVRGDYTKAEVQNMPAQPGFVVVPPDGAPDEATTAPVPGARDSAAAAEFRTAFGDLAGFIDQQRVAADADRDRSKFPPLNLTDLRLKLLDGLNPEKTVPRRLADRLSFSPGKWTFADTLEPILTYPEFDEPMYTVLAKKDPDLLLPGVREIEKDSVLLLETNRQFIESYMVGLNHEFARELLWREFPTDQRGSYFRQFWDVSQQLAVATSQAERDRAKDVSELHLWPAATALGGNTANGPEPERLVLLVKSELFRRFPTAVVYAAKAKVGLRQRQPKDPADAAAGEEIEKFPVFAGEIGEDVRFFGFDLTLVQARGSANNPGWFFVIQQQPSEPHFGLDIAPAVPKVGSDLNWGEVSSSHVELTSSKAGRFATFDSSAKCAKATLQRPIRILFHADKLLPEN